MGIPPPPTSFAIVVDAPFTDTDLADVSLRGDEFSVFHLIKNQAPIF